MSKDLYFHGGPMETDFFAGGSFWTRDIQTAMEYAGDDPVYAIRIDPFRDLEYVDGQDDAYMTDGFQDWPDQTSEIQTRLDQGYQAVGYDDGIWISAYALSNRRIRRLKRQEQ